MFNTISLPKIMVALCQIYDISAYFSIYIDTAMIQDVITCRDRYFALKYALMEKNIIFYHFIIL